MDRGVKVVVIDVVKVKIRAIEKRKSLKRGSHIGTDCKLLS